MVNLDRLRVSLTKNGYLKIADVVKRHPRWEVLENIHGVYRGINLARSQAANIMGEDLSGDVPEFWDEIRSFDEKTIDAFTLTAIIMSHVDLIRLLAESAQGDMKGHLRRGRIGEKAYTNLIYALSCCGVCEYERGVEGTTYDMRSVVYALREAGHLVRQLIEFKLAVCGWRPEVRGGTEFFAACEENEINRVFGLSMRDFRAWLGGRLRIEPPTERDADWPRIPR